MKRMILTAGAVALASMTAEAHDGRRFDIQVHNGQIFAQGYLSGDNPTDDGGGIVRPYFNANHGHFTNSPLPGSTNASADLPGFDIFAGSPLAGSDVGIELIGASKWESPPITPDTGMVPEGTVPTLTSLGTGEEIFVGLGSSFVSTGSPGSLALAQNVSASGALDIDLTYDIGIQPEDTIFVLDFVLSTDAPGIEPSNTVHVMLAPDGSGPVERLHYASLFLEEYLGEAIPAPASVGLFGAGMIAFARRRRH